MNVSGSMQTIDPTDSGDGNSRRETARRIWEEYYPRMVVFVEMMDRRFRSESEDIAQEILLKVFLHLDEYLSAYSFSTWIYKIAKNHCLDLLRRHRVRPESCADGYSPDLVPSYVWNPERLYIENETNGAIDSCIDTLSDTDRRIAFLKFFELLDSREIGRILGMPAGTVRYRLMRIRAEVKHFLEKNHGTKRVVPR